MKFGLSTITRGVFGNGASYACIEGEARNGPIDMQPNGCVSGFALRTLLLV
jgi:hypothetical protein